MRNTNVYQISSSLTLEFHNEDINRKMEYFFIKNRHHKHNDEIIFVEIGLTPDIIDAHKRLTLIFHFHLYFYSLILDI